MSDPVSLASLFEAAEQAAVGGDFAAAARLLADAAGTQEATLGPDHLDLANTLNNLAVAHERSGQLDDAEREYRRAHAIAARTLPADDPIVTTSAQNLREFCEANNRPVEASALRLAEIDHAGAATTVVLARSPQADIPTGPIEPLAMTFAAEAAAVPRSAPTAASGTAHPPNPNPSPVRTTPATHLTPASPALATPAVAAASPTSTAAGPRSRLSIPVFVALGAVVALVVWLLAGRGPAAPPAQPEAAAPAAKTATRAGATAAGQPVAPSPRPPAPAGAPTAAPSAAGTAVDGLTVSDAQLCTTLSSGYQCQAAGTAVGAGRLTFYTRLVALQNTSVVHRWYRGNELRQAVRLDVPARRQGFRTFSRATVSPSEGEWRVELRSRDGQLLHAERFTVR